MQYAPDLGPAGGFAGWRSVRRPAAGRRATRHHNPGSHLMAKHDVDPVLRQLFGRSTSPGRPRCLSR
jgi:hypothetical protein